MDTIYALASAQGKAGVAVVRLSGPRSHDAVRLLAGRVPEPRVARLATLRDQEKNLLDQALVLVFEDGASFTGEASAELHLHGSRATIAAVLAELGKIDSVRLAEPGEFTRRALDNGKMDLTEVEGLADLIESETEAQRKQALRTLEGALGDRVAQWRENLVRAMALLAATIDFADEEVPEDVSPEVEALIKGVMADLNSEIAGVSIAERVRDGFEVAILGEPNIGKSTLLNALAGREAAITSDIAGTTRDIVEVRMDLNGLPVTFLDTAGLRETEDQIETLGIQRALERAEKSDIRLILIDGSLPPGVVLRDGDIVRTGKGDSSDSETSISGKTGQGIQSVLAEISEDLANRASIVGTAVHQRHKTAMEDTSVLLESALLEVSYGQERADLAAEELRVAVRRLDALVGRVDVEDVLDIVFSSFCLGK